MNIILLRQIWTVSGILINIIGLGFMLAYPTCILPGLKSKDSDIVTNTDEASWIASCIGLANIPGFIVSSYFMDKYGRKMCHAVLILPGIIGWFIIHFSKNISTIIIGRFLNGFSSGGTVILGAIIIGEYSSPEYRGIFLNLKTAATCAGIITAHIFGNYFHWRTVALIGTVAPIVALLITCTWPESPSWLIMMNRFEESEKSFYWIRGKSKLSTEELKHMHHAQIESEKLAKNLDVTIGEKAVDFIKKFGEKDFLKPILITTIAFTLLEACGRHTFPAYALDILGGFNKDKSQAFYYTLGIDIITTASTLCSSVIVKLCKRRTLLFSSGLSSLIVLVIICIYMFLVSKDIIPNDKPWLPLTLFGLYFVLANLGCTPVPLGLLGEIFPVKHRSVATSVCGILMACILMVALKMTPILLDTVQVYGTFSIFAGFMIGTLLYLYFELPETKNRSLQEIEDFFKYGKFLDHNEILATDDANEKMLRLEEKI